MNRQERKRVTSPRRDYYTTITLFALIGTLIFRILLEYLIGDSGITYFSVANEIYLVVAGTVSYGLSEAVAMLVRYRVRREQFKNAQKVLNSALLFGGVVGLIFSVCFVFWGNIIAERVMHIPLAGLSLSLMAPAMFFFILTGVFRGYFQGNGSRIPSMHSHILHTVFVFAGGIIGTTLLRGYGLKVSALLQNDDCASAYGAMGASIGILTASVFCFLHVLILYLIYRRSIKRQMSRELQKNQDTRFHIFHMLIGTGGVYSALWICLYSTSLMDQYLYFNFSSEKEGLITNWGAYYGKCLSIIGIICAIICIFCLMPIRRIMLLIEREEHRVAREKLGILFHQCALITIPTAVFLAVLSENMLDALFAGSQKYAVAWMQIGSVMIVPCVFASVFVEILLKSRRIKYVVGIGIIALLLHTGLLILLLKTTQLGITAVFLAGIAFYVVIMVCGFFLIRRSFQYTQEWMKSFVVTILSSAIAGVIAMLLNKVFAPMLGTVISLIICLLVAILVYMVLLIVMRAFRDGEMEEMPGGRILSLLAGLIHFS
ncbi:MAG: polysaccharide biosynthesis C-terminal domain-containing protein [Suilimivivens sp.]